MQKILITDFFGTLISSDIEQAEYKCGYGNQLDNSGNHIINILNDEKYSSKILEKMFILLDRELKDYLEDGNIVKIVTSDNGHEGIDWFIEQVIPRFNSLKEYKSQIDIYFANIRQDCCHSILDKANIYVEDGCKYFDYNDIKIGILDKKEEIFDVIGTIDLKTKELYALGDDYNDLSMLTKCITIGGKSALIKENLYTYKEYLSQTTHTTICKKADMDYWLMIEDLMVKRVSNRSVLNDYLNLRKIRNNICDEIPYEEWVETRILELYKSLRSSRLDIQRIFEEPIIYEIANHITDNLEYKTFREKSLDKLHLYPSFKSFMISILNQYTGEKEKQYIK